MALKKKDVPGPSFALVFHPQRDSEYTHFENASEVPFEPTASTFSRVNAWWMADAALLSYWDEDEACKRFVAAGLQAAPLVSDARTDTQCYVAWTSQFTFVAIRGTESDSLPDLITNARIRLKAWDGLANENAHEGFQLALDSVWPGIVQLLKPVADRPVWITGHSLGGALATLAADRLIRTGTALGLGTLGGVYTFGSPLVGDRAFVDGYNRRNPSRSFRFVNDQDAVTRVPPLLAGYRHVNRERLVGENDAHLFLVEPLIDHTPRRYAVFVWNALVGPVASAG